MSVPIPPDKMADYSASALRRQEAGQRRLLKRRDRAWEVARQAAEILVAEFSARQVAAFGSVVAPGRVHERSDLDLAVWGLPEELYLRAVARLLAIDAAIPVDLVRVEDAPPALRERIEAKGVPL